MRRSAIIEVIAALLILLFLYASVSKMLKYDQFKAALYNQPIPAWSVPILVWLLPVAELIIVALLLASRTRLHGLYCSALLMLIFTGYVGLVLADTFSRVPCSCGGILKNMGWNTHLLFNILFLLLATAGIILSKKGKKTRETDFSPAV